MVSDKFKYQLRKEAQKWQNEGLIESDIYERLATRYHFEKLETISNNRFLAVIITLGFILLGLAVITFVAANWQVWSKLIKVSILLGFFILINTAGFYLYREQSEDWKARLGQGLLLLGGLSLGANIGLMSQIFHQTGATYKLFWFWGLGVLFMAYGLRLTSLGILSLILIGISYFASFYAISMEHLTLQIQLMPLLIAVLFVSLAYWCKSRWIFALSIILFTISLNTNFTILVVNLYDQNSYFLPNIIFLGFYTLPSVLLWAYQDDLGFLSNRVSLGFSAISRKICIFYLGLLFYILSFNFWSYDNLSSRKKVTIESPIPSDWFPFIAVLTILLIVSVWWWWKLGRSQRNNLLWRIDRNSSAIGIMILTNSLLVWWHQRINPLGEFATVMFNLLLFLLAIGLIQQSLKSGKRLGYWWGIILLSVQLFSRMLEYDTGLLFKAVVLFISGISVIFAGIWFENHLKRLQHVRTSEDGISS
ncbi:MAG: DUF2157 domain-containing protein [Xenococcaceae cyanobacterium MO_188.B19]|nr:DUF2157 domain-containing protein [Xenococcaceae cyanobacterium MO_188.B19]